MVVQVLAVYTVSPVEERTRSATGHVPLSHLFERILLPKQHPILSTAQRHIRREFRALVSGPIERVVFRTRDTRLGLQDKQSIGLIAVHTFFPVPEGSVLGAVDVPVGMVGHFLVTGQDDAVVGGGVGGV